MWAGVIFTMCFGMHKHKCSIASGASPDPDSLPRLVTRDFKGPSGPLTVEQPDLVLSGSPTDMGGYWDSVGTSEGFQDLASPKEDLWIKAEMEAY